MCQRLNFNPKNNSVINKFMCSLTLMCLFKRHIQCKLKGITTGKLQKLSFSLKENYFLLIVDFK